MIESRHTAPFIHAFATTSNAFRWCLLIRCAAISTTPPVLSDPILTELFLLPHLLILVPADPVGILIEPDEFKLNGKRYVRHCVTAKSQKHTRKKTSVVWQMCSTLNGVYVMNRPCLLSRPLVARKGKKDHWIHAGYPGACRSPLLDWIGASLKSSSNPIQ
jgi:hypothetical protein